MSQLLTQRKVQVCNKCTHNQQIRPKYHPTVATQNRKKPKKLKKGIAVRLPFNQLLPWHRKSVVGDSREAQVGVESHPPKSPAKSLMITKVFYNNNYFELWTMLWNICAAVREWGTRQNFCNLKINVFYPVCTGCQCRIWASFITEGMELTITGSWFFSSISMCL